MYRFISQRSHGVIASSVLYWTSLITNTVTNTDLDLVKEVVLLSFL